MGALGLGVGVQPASTNPPPREIVNSHAFRRTPTQNDERTGDGVKPKEGRRGTRLSASETPGSQRCASVYARPAHPAAPLWINHLVRRGVLS